MKINSAFPGLEPNFFGRPLLSLFVFLTLITGLIYPLVVTGLAAEIFSYQANGSLIRVHGQFVGSRLIGQNFSQPEYFWGRLSATSPMSDNGSSSGGSNYGPLDPLLLTAVQNRIQALHHADPNMNTPIPVDLVTASASGLDPDISLAAAEYQLSRVAKARHVSPEWIQKRLLAQTQSVWGGFLGEPRVNVLLLNLSLDADQTN